MSWPNPFILRHGDGYYFITSLPEYERLELRYASTLNGLIAAPATTVWRKPDSGPCSALIWAPELYVINGQWVIYFAAAPSREIKEELFQHRMYALLCDDADPLSGHWQPCHRMQTHFDTFALDATHFVHRGKNWYLWAQKDPAIPCNSNLYLE